MGSTLGSSLRHLESDQFDTAGPADFIRIGSVKRHAHILCPRALAEVSVTQQMNQLSHAGPGVGHPL